MSAETTTEPSARTLASRANGARSNGPTTTEGKARSSQNALKHGLRTKDTLVIEAGDEEAFEYHRDSLLEALNPTDAVQLDVATTIVKNSWRLRQIQAMEANLFAETIEAGKPAHETLADKRLTNLSRHEASISRALFRARKEFRDLKKLEDEHNRERERTKAEIAETYARYKAKIQEETQDLIEQMQKDKSDSAQTNLAPESKPPKPGSWKQAKRVAQVIDDPSSTRHKGGQQAA